MSYSDFLILPGVGNVTFPPTGSSILNSALSSPLTSSTQCRAFENSTRTVGNFYLTSSQFVNIPNTKSVSLRMWARLTYFNNNTVSLLAKTNPPNNATNGSMSGTLPNTGYEFIYDPGGSPGRLYYNFGGYSAGRASRETGLLGSIAVGTDVWVGMRMDIIPVLINRLVNGTPVSSSFKDIVTLYTASLATPNNWQQVYTTEILSTSAQFVPWGSFTTKNNGQQGAAILVNSSSYGFCVDCGQTPIYNRVYVDDFQIFVEDAF